MSNLSDFSSPVRTVGDASLLLPKGSKAQFVSRTQDGSFLDIGTADFVIAWRINLAALLNDGTDERPASSSWLWSISASQTADDDSLSARLQASTSTITVYYKTGNTTRAQLSIDYSSFAGWDGRIGDEYHCVLRKTGDTLKFGIVGRDEYAGPYVLQSVEVVSSAAVSMDTLGMGTTGSFIWGDRYTNFTDESVYISNWVIASVAATKSHATYGTDTDTGILRFAIDSHTMLSASSEWGPIRSFDFCNSGKTRKRVLYQSQVEVSDTLVCLHSGHVLDFVQDDSPTKTPEALPPYSHVGYRPQHRNGTGASPKAARYGQVIATVSRPVSIKVNSLITLLDRLSVDTGERIAPPIPIVDAKMVNDVSAATDNKESFDWFIPGTESHDQASVFINHAGESVIVHIGRHSDVTADQPDTGDTMYQTGSITTVYANAPPVSHAIPYPAGATGNHRSTTYCGGMVYHGGYTYSHSRSHDTNNGAWRFWRVAANGTVESFDLTANASASNTSPAAGIPRACIMLDDKHALFVASVRMSATTGYWGLAGVIIDLENWSSATIGCFGARDGTQLAPSKGSVSWADKSLYIAADPVALAQIDAGVLDASLLVRDVFCTADCLAAVVKGGKKHIALMYSGRPDAQRTDDPDLGVDTQTLQTFTFDGTKLVPANTHDLRPLLKQISPGVHPFYGHRPAVNYIRPYLVPNGTGLRIVTVSADGSGFADAADPGNDSWAGSLPDYGGTHLGSIHIADWTVPFLSTEVHTGLANIAQYNGDALTAVPSAACYAVEPVLDGDDVVLLTPVLEGLPNKISEGQSPAIQVAARLPAMPQTSPGKNDSTDQADLDASVAAIIAGSGAMIETTYIGAGQTLALEIGKGPNTNDALNGHTIYIAGANGNHKTTIADYDATQGTEISLAANPSFSLVPGDKLRIFDTNQVTADATLTEATAAKVAAQAGGNSYATTIATAITETTFTLSAGSTVDGDYVGQNIKITKAGDATRFGSTTIVGYTGATKTVRIQEPLNFTLQAGDGVAIITPTISVGPTNTESVPVSRTAVLVPGEGSLTVEDGFHIETTDSNALHAVDFRRDMPSNTQIAKTVSVSTSTSAVVATVDDNSSSASLVRLTGVSATPVGTPCELKVVVKYEDNSNRTGTVPVTVTA